jgi:16S rRNA (guanine527-N7)-methyltransferase
LPPAYAEVLDDGLARLGLDLAADQRAAIDGHVRLLLAWTSAINLTAIRDPRAVAVGHVLDSLAAVPRLRSLGIDALVDLGSGGGFPGLPLAVALPARQALLVESTGKKARFLETAIAAIGPIAGTAVAPVRAETLARDPAHRGAWPCVTARAVAALPDLIELAVPLLRPGGVLVAWKRGDLAAELAAGRRALDALGGGGIEPTPVDLPGLAGHTLILVSAAGVAPVAYPRDPAARARRPW